MLLFRSEEEVVEGVQFIPQVPVQILFSQPRKEEIAEVCQPLPLEHVQKRVAEQSVDILVLPFKE